MVQRISKLKSQASSITIGLMLQYVDWTRLIVMARQYRLPGRGTARNQLSKIPFRFVPLPRPNTISRDSYAHSISETYHPLFDW